MTNMAGKQDQLRAQLKAAGDEYVAVRDSLANARNALEPLIVAALKAGIPAVEVERLTHLSRETIRTARRAAGLPPAPHGGHR